MLVREVQTEDLEKINNFLKFYSIKVIFPLLIKIIKLKLFLMKIY